MNVMATSLSTEQLIGLMISASYFLGILFLFALVVQSISERRRDAAASRNASSSWTYIGLALASFGYTWYCEDLIYLTYLKPKMHPHEGPRYDIIHAMEFHGLRAKCRSVVEEQHRAYASARRKLATEHGTLRAGMDHRV
jgi:hypothetical protein